MSAFLIPLRFDSALKLLLPIILIGLGLIMLIGLWRWWRQKQSLIQPLVEELTSAAASTDAEKPTQTAAFQQVAVASEEIMTIEESQIISSPDAEESQLKISTESEELIEQQLNPFAVDDSVRSMYTTMEESQATQSPSSFHAAIENYLLKTYSWQMTPETIDRDFRKILLRSEASDSEATENSKTLLQIDRAYFVERLTSRGVFTQDAIQDIADRLEAIRQEIVSAAHEAEEHHIALDLRQQIEAYLISTPKEQLFCDGILPAFKSILEDRAVDSKTLSQRLTPYNREALRQILIQRLTHLRNITYEELELALDALGTTRDRVLSESQSPLELPLPLINEQLQEPEFEELETESEFEELASESLSTRPPQAEPPQAPAAKTPALYWTSWDQVKINPAKTTTVSNQEQNAAALTWMTWDELSRQDGVVPDRSTPNLSNSPEQPDSLNQPDSLEQPDSTDD